MINDIGGFVRGQRGEQKISQSKLAKEADVSIRSITTLENNKKVSISTIEKIAKALGFKAKVKIEFIKED